LRLGILEWLEGNAMQSQNGCEMLERCSDEMKPRGIFVYHFLEGGHGKEGSALQMIQSDTTDKIQLNLPSQLT